MRFLQHFLPGQPLEENGHVSAGATSSLRFESKGRVVVTGLDLEWSDMFLEETQFAATQGSAFLVETRPAGKHYDFDRVAARGEMFASVRDVDTAPRWLANAELVFDPVDRLRVSLQISGIGPYFLDAENRFEYPGHAIANLRTQLRLPAGFSLAARLNNFTDRDIADRADYAFGQFRYFPGRGREFFVELGYSPALRSR